jgi:hypothetical protein
VNAAGPLEPLESTFFRSRDIKPVMGEDDPFVAMAVRV